mgnify:CR=1 FL=1|jgi:hypothetical protein
MRGLFDVNTLDQFVLNRLRPSAEVLSMGLILFEEEIEDEFERILLSQFSLITSIDQFIAEFIAQFGQIPKRHCSILTEFFSPPRSV